MAAAVTAGILGHTECSGSMTGAYFGEGEALAFWVVVFSARPQDRR